MSKRPGYKPITKASNAAQIRLQKDLEEATVMADVTITFPNPDNIQKFHVRLLISHGIWAGGKFDFSFDIPNDWPHQRPEVKILTRVWHPNIAEDGPVCLNILRDNYTPVMSISHLIAGLQYLFDQPNPQSPLNFDASQQYLQNYEAFKVKAEQYKDEYCPK